jgi:hypothetical protein
MLGQSLSTSLAVRVPHHGAKEGVLECSGGGGRFGRSLCLGDARGVLRLQQLEQRGGALGQRVVLARELPLL